ncbi:MAG: ABC transporter permease, partial [Pseudomonadota bacterium]
MSAETVSFALSVAVIFAALLRAATPVILAALGGLVSDLAGVINVALEGMMLVAAFGGVMGSAYAPMVFPFLPTWAYPLVGCAVGLGAALLASLVLGLFHLEFGADLIVAGIVLNVLAAAGTVFLMVTLTGDKGSTANLSSHSLPTLAIPGL